MRPPWNRTRSLIGIDVGSSRIKAAQVVRSRQGWRVASSASVERLGESAIPSVEELEKLGRVLESAGFRGSGVVVGAPRGVLTSAVLDLPPKTSGAPIEHICNAEFARMFRLTPGSYEIHAWEMPSASDRTTTTQMAVSALECEKAGKLVTPFEAVGLRVEAIDLASEAVCRACRVACSDTEELTTLLDIGRSGVDLSVFHGGEVVYQRWMQGSGTDSLLDSLSRSLRVSERAAGVLVRRVGLGGIERDGAEPVAMSRMMSIVREYAEGLLHQMLGSVAYVLDRFPGESVARVRVVGGGAVIPCFAPYLAELTGLDARVLAPSDCGFSGGSAAADPAILTALGHALWRDE